MRIRVLLRCNAFERAKGKITYRKREELGKIRGLFAYMEEVVFVIICFLRIPSLFYLRLFRAKFSYMYIMSRRMVRLFS